MAGKARSWCVVAVVVLAVVATVVRGQGLDYKAWLGEEPLTPQRIVEDLVAYFSVRDPHGIPVLTVPERIDIPGNVAATQITFFNPSVAGHSGLRLEYINVNLTSLSATARISLPWINFQGDYEWPGFYSNSEGFGNITMVGIETSLDLYFGVDDNGRLTVDPKMDLQYQDLQLNFTGLIYTHSFVVGAAGTFFSTIIQPLIFGRVQTRVQEAVNSRLEQRLQNITFPDSISPIDYAMARFRKRLIQENRDPLKLSDKEKHLTWGVTVQLQDIEVRGLSTLHRTHEISAQFIDNTAYVTVQLGTQALKGDVNWSLSASLLPAVKGHMTLELESVAVTVEAQQPANIRSPPTLRKIDIKLGNLAVRSEGEATFDYLVEALVNIVPNCLRDQLMDRVESVVHQGIQKEFNKLDIYRIVMDRLAKN